MTWHFLSYSSGNPSSSNAMLWKKWDTSNMLTNVFIPLLCFLLKPFIKTLMVFCLDFEMKHWIDLDLHASEDKDFTCLTVLVFTLLSKLKSKASVLHFSTFSFCAKNPQHDKKHLLEHSEEQFKYRGLAWLLNIFKMNLLLFCHEVCADLKLESQLLKHACNSTPASNLLAETKTT